MKLRTATALTCLGLLSFGCGQLDTGGGGEGDKVNFKSGYVFVRSRNVFVADSSNYEAARQLTTSSDCSWPAVSPDGRVIVYVRGGTSIRKVNPDGTGDGLLYDGAGSVLSQPAVSPDGSRVAFVVGSPNGAIRIVNIDGSGEHDIPQSSHDASPCFFADGRSVAVINATASTIDALEISGGVRGVLVANPSSLVFNRLALAPNGASVAVEVRDGSRTHVYVANAGGDLQLLAYTGPSASERSPTFVDARRVGFVSDAGGTQAIYESEIGAGTDESPVPKVADADQCMFGGR